MLGFKVVWDDPGHTVIRLYVGEYWDWADLLHATHEIVKLMTSVKHQVDIISIMRPSAAVPDGDVIGHLRQIIEAMPGNSGIHIMVGGNVFINSALRELSRCYEPVMGRLFQADSLSVAYRIIARNRPEVYEIDLLSA